MPITSDGFKYVLVVVDSYTRYTWFFPTKTTKTREMCEHLHFLFNVFGIPLTIISDRGSSFTSNEFLLFLKEFGIIHRKVAVASPWANGLAERANRFLKSSLVRLSNEPEDWKLLLNKIQYVVNNTVNSSINCTPKLLLGYDQHFHSDSSLKVVIDALAEFNESFLNSRERAQDIARLTTSKIQNYNKAYFDKSHKSPSLYNVNDYVLVRSLQFKIGESKKIKNKYKGPYMISKVLGHNRYVVQDIPGFNVSSRPYNSILSSDKIKPWIKPLEN